MNRFPAWIAAALLAAPVVAGAEQVKQLGELEIHYNAMPTSDLLPDVARAYKIDRSPNRGLVTIAVLKKNPMGVAMPVKAEVKTSTVNLSAQLANVEMREVVEGTAVYYIGEFRVSAPETLKFNVAVKPAGSGQTQSFEFQKQFFP